MGVHKLVGVAVVVALCLGRSAAGAEGEATRCRHTLKGMFTRFSWQRHKRPWYEHVLWYLPSRAADLLDCVGIEVGAGVGAHANIHATRLLQLGIGREESVRVGLMSRYPVVVDQELRERAAGWWWELDLRRNTVLGAAPSVDICESDVARRYYKAADPAGFGVSLFPGIVGISVELKFHEVVDFVKGFATLDSRGDDY